ncbi:MAG TPA: hypothetical protein VEL76_19735 [Gemmataceae bacterium]|nr:hypothetical protein [Gemmataceae bacterium]
MNSASFYGGPYDGLELAPDEAAQKCIPLTIPICGVNRFFLLLPHPELWEIADWRSLADLGRLYPYERCPSATRDAFRFVTGGEFAEAMRRGEAA